MRLPRHIGIIPDGNRRWAVREGMDKADGYDHGIAPGMELFRMCRELGVEEMTFYGFTVDNTKRPSAQRRAFTAACIAAVGGAIKGGCKSFSAGKYEVICISQRISALYNPPQLRKGRYEDQFPCKLQLGMGFRLKGRAAGREVENR